MKTTPFAAIFTLVPLVAGHGWVGWISVDGKRYDGNVPLQATVQSPIRGIADNGPVDTSSTDMACGLQSTNAALIADVNPGSTLTVKWTTHFDLTWRHQVGPIMTYMAPCGSTPCDTFDGSGAKWFKIAQFSYSDASTKTWWQNMLYANQTIDVKLPTNLSPGGYLIRHEVISLQAGAEFYPSCFQVNMGGSGTGTPDGTLSFPGAYDASSYPVNAYNFQPEEFEFVGGPLSSLANLDQNPGGSAGVAGGAGTGDGAGTDASTSSSGSGAPVTTATAVSSMAATASSTTVASPSISAATAQSEAPQPSSAGHCRAKFRRDERRSYPHPR